MSNKTTICPMPFNSIAYNITGRIGPCTQCEITDFKSLDDYWNSKELKQLRSDMKNGIRNPACNECYRREDSGAWNLRQSLVEHTVNFNYDIEEPVVEQVWLRSSNLCNYLCIDCQAVTSSAIWKEDIDRGLKEKTPIIIYPGNDPDAVIGDVKEIAHTLKNINFSGGEPLLHWQHWDLLNHMINIGINPSVGYYSNLSILKYKGQKLTDALNHFSDVEITIGFDAMDDGCGYFRRNMSWEGTLENVRTLRAESPHVKITAAVTFTWVNAINASRMMQWLRKNYPYIDITMNLVMHEHLDMQVAPEFKKVQIEKAFRDLIESNLMDRHINDRAETFITYMWAVDDSAKFNDALIWLKSMDEWRKNDFRVAFPEHNDIHYEDYMIGSVAEPGLLQQS